MIFLREITREDVPIINSWRNDRELQTSLGSPFRFVNIETEQQWFDGYLNNRSSNVRCAICINETTQIVGVVYLVNIDHVSRNAEIGIMLGKKTHQDKGLGNKASIMMLDYGFSNLNLNRIYCSILEDNYRSINITKKIGCCREGTLREAVYKNGKYYNLIMFSILKHEYIAMTASRRNRMANYEVRKITKYLASHDYENAESTSRSAISEYYDTNVLESILLLHLRVLKALGKNEEAEVIRNRFANK